MNAKTPHPDETRTFLNWVASPEFATLYANALPGFFPLSSEPVTLEDPLAQEFISWRQKCEPTIRSTYQILSRGTPNLENETWTHPPTSSAAPSRRDAKRLQDGLASWYDRRKLVTGTLRAGNLRRGIIHGRQGVEPSHSYPAANVRDPCPPQTEKHPVLAHRRFPGACGDRLRRS